MAYNGRNNYQNGQGGYNSRYQQPSLPDGYLDGGYFSPAKDGQKRAMKREYILGYPEQIARALDDRDKNKSTQLRKFYDYCIRIRDALEQGKTFQEVESDFCRLTAFAKYAENRSRVTSLFVDFIDRNVKIVQSKESFYAFLKHFEAVIVYIKK